MSSFHNPYSPGGGGPFANVETQVRGFWRRVSDGLEVHQLWEQFKADAWAGYGWYSKEVEWKPVPGEPHWKRYWRITRAVFWAMVMKLSPARRVLLIIALALVVLGIFGTEVQVSDRTVINLGGGQAILGALALLLLLALELADRVTMKRDLEIAKEIQRWLVPETPPQIPGIEIAFASRAANTVAGDYYDAFLRPGPSAAGEGSESSAADSRRLLLVVADVAGKSVPAALLMATLQASLRTLALAPSPLPELAANLNAYVCEISQAGRRFITAFLAELDLATHKLTYVNAGHNQPMLVRSPGVSGMLGSVERLSEGGLPLGITRHIRYQSGEASLAAGDRLVIFTDGAVEAENEAADEFGEGRLLVELQAGRGARAADALKRLMVSIDAFVGRAPQHDDITCLILDRLR
ncbi:MAG TPA: PP2C family protein-serine/threonine phosphatase [Terriglobia bacterium]|nr:PP2C family protein-serine/threonine phosphatase [Terriglobia bacterium]